VRGSTLLTTLPSTCSGPELVEGSASKGTHRPLLLLLLLALPLIAAAFAWSALPSLEGVQPGFKFVVMGDNRTGGPDVTEVTDTYKTILAEINQLRPAFAILGGDMIRGGTDDETTIRQMWQNWSEATSALQVPLFKVIGNHDVWNALSEKLYQEIFGEPLYYSFNYGGCHFVVLDTELQGEAPKIVGRQFQWLEDDLTRNSDALFTFVFLHRPLWEEPRGDPEAWAPVHRLLVEKGVDAVFGGHDHMYSADEVDGIRYIITGGAGAPIGAGREAMGEFFHYCLVSVEPNDFTIAVIKPGNIKPEDYVLAKDLRLIRTIVNDWIRDPIVDLQQQGAQKPVSFEIRNPSAAAISGKVTWDLTATSWRIEPLSSPYSVPAGDSTTLTFLATPPDRGLYPTPKASVEFPSPRGTALTSQKPLLFLPKIHVPKRTSPVPVLDGQINPGEWAGATSLTDFPLNNGLPLATQPTTAYLTWDEQNLYLAFQCQESQMADLKADKTQRDSDVWSDDCVEVFLDTNHNRTSYYQFIVNSKGVISDSFHPQPSTTGDLSWNAHPVVAASTQPDHWTVEMAIPFADMGAVPKPGDLWSFNLGRERQPKPREFSIFSCTYGGFNNPARFADLYFGD